jgi:hypothetical protein
LQNSIQNSWLVDIVGGIIATASPNFDNAVNSLALHKLQTKLDRPMEDIMLEMRAIEQLKNRIDVIELLFAFYIFTSIHA